MIQFLCFLLATIFAFLAAAGVPNPPRLGFLAFALGLLALGLLVGAGPFWRAG
jgi:hypothetical protein